MIILTIFKKIIRHLCSNKSQRIGLIRNINIDSGNNLQRRVLISYLCSLFEVDVQKRMDRTYYFEINEIIKAFTEMGFCVDVVNCLEVGKIQIIKDTKYDVLFGFGDVFYKMTLLQPTAKSIIYMTENHPELSKREEDRRRQYYFERHKRKVKYERSGIFYKTQHMNKKYDDIITLSETKPFEKDYQNVFEIYPTGLINSSFDLTEKNHETTKKNYLWLGSSGAVHKGLDLLIDVFKNKKDINLHICGLREGERHFLKIPNQPNIKIYGTININSLKFRNIINICTFIILPSCSEAMSTSITTGMLHGLIPIVMKDAGFNRLGSNAIFLSSFQIDYIDNTLNKLSAENNKYLNELSRKNYNFARENFVIDSYSKNINFILNKILK